MQNWTLITGASEGLGVEFARIAAAEGRNLILTARSEDKLKALASELRSDAVQVEVIPADLNDLAQAEKMWAKASKARRIDILVKNAGLGRYGRYDDEGWERELTTINVNITALSLLMKRAIALIPAEPDWPEATARTRPRRRPRGVASVARAEPVRPTTT